MVRPRTGIASEQETNICLGGFFSKKASDGQKFSGFMVFQKMLAGFAASNESLASDKLQCLFSKNMLDCLMNQASQSDRFVYRAAIHTLKSVENVTTAKPHILSNVLRRLLSSHGAYNFDIRTKTKTIDKLLRLTGNGNEKSVLQAVREPLAHLKTITPAAGGKKNGEAEQMIRSFIEYLTKIIHALVVDTSSELDVKTFKQSAILDSLKDLAYIANNDSQIVPSVLVSDTLRDLARERLETSLGKLAKFCGQYKIFCSAIEELDLSTAKLDEELATAKEEALTRMKKLLKSKKSADGAQQSLSQGLAMLYAVSIFRLYNEDADAMEVLSDLAEQAPEKGVAATESSEFLVEVLLSMVTRSSLLMREISHQVFGTLSSQISEEGLDLLLEPLSAPENVQGQKELFNIEDDDVIAEGDGDDDDDDEDEDDDDVEVVDVEDASDVEIGSDTQFVSLNGQGEDDDSDSDDEDDESEEETEQDKEMADLDQAIGNILKSHRLDKDDDAQSSDNDADMSDSEMLALDEKLTEVFKQRKKARPDSTKDKRQAKRTVVDFKNRILDLLEIYIRNEVGNPLALNLLLPLLRLIRTTKEKQLATRAHSVIAEFKRAGKKAKGGKKDKDSGDAVAAKAAEVDTDKLMAILAEIHDEARKEAGNSHVTAASIAALKVVTAIMAADRSMHERIIALYSRTLADWPHCKGRTQFSHYWNSWVPPKA